MSDRCERCGRTLTDEQSIELGFGPVCWGKVQGQTDGGLFKEEFCDQYDPSLSSAGDIVLARREGMVITNVPHTICLHSPDGYEWGYGGSGPADLALNILAMFLPKRKVELLHQDFKREFIAGMPEEGGTIKREDILHWISWQEVERL